MPRSATRGEHACPFCAANPKTNAGLHSHYAQRPSCRRQLSLVLEAKYAAAPPLPEATQPVGYDEMALDTEPPANDVVAQQPYFAPHTAVDNAADNDPDLDAPGSERWIEDFPEPAGCVLDGGAKGKTAFEVYREQQEELGLLPWGDFESAGDWELAKWLVEAGVSRGKIEEFLKLEKIRHGAKPSYHNAYSFYQKIDSLPAGPKWECEMLQITGDILDSDGNPVTEEIMANPAFKDHMFYAPQRIYRDEQCTNREYGEMHTGDRWWELQEKIPAGHTVCPIIIGTDETQLSNFSGDKKAWPAYAAPANVSDDVRRKPNSHAMVLIGYIPVSKFQCFSRAKDRSAARQDLYHYCMKVLLNGLIKPGNDGVRMLCADAHFRMNHPLVVAHLADHPERCLASCCAENRCPECKVAANKRGDPIRSRPREPGETIKILRKQADGLDPPEFEELGLRQNDPFWKDLPHCDIYRSFYPDLLHQLHKGVFKDHTVSWATESVDGSTKEKEAEIDRRFKAMLDHPSLRHFQQGISLVSQWTGNEYKNMEKVFLGVINGAVEPQVMLAVRGILDFIYYAHFETHTDKSLMRLEAAWLMFHDNKGVFLRTGIREHFNIPKIHAMQHYVALIRLGGSTAGKSTELSERLHIDCAKMGYRASNRKNYLAQMTQWLSRRDAIYKFSAYLDWAVPIYHASIVPPSEPATTPSSIAAAPVTASLPFKIAKSAPFSLSAQVLETEFGANDFLHHLETFLRSEAIYPSDFDSIHTNFPVYKPSLTVVAI
ncbi:hypothetical protein MIND_01235400 [Mycena indigotica]|uniref:Uncharacterized protein n=1 Tax=Mycena indigotica TaxID=2126181 RepID=A0A8H6S6A8_9AGAR|nr:uncharacterized protein MIND_01235400 [Mycena indigotica]KAF7292090.1 hypothetical protein MIND_01235400 [Mycena indigotica]